MGVATQSEKRAPSDAENGLAPPPKKKWIQQHYAGSENEQIVYSTEPCQPEDLSGRQTEVEFITVPAPPYIVSEVTVEETGPASSPVESTPQPSTPSPGNMVYIDSAGEELGPHFITQFASRESPVYTELGQYERPQKSYYIVQDSKNEQRFDYLPAVRPRMVESTGDYQQIDCLDTKPRRTSSTTRETHNKLEKNRRAHMRECFEVLRKQLPDTEDKRLSNLGILKMACRSIQLLKRKEREMEHTIELLARDKIANQQKLALLKKEVPEAEILEPAVSVFHEEEVVETHREASPPSGVFADPWRSLGIPLIQKDSTQEDDRESRTTATASERGDLSDPEDLNAHNYCLDRQNPATSRLHEPVRLQVLSAPAPPTRVYNRPVKIEPVEDEYVVIRDSQFSQDRVDVEVRKHGESAKRLLQPSYPGYSQVTKVDGRPIKIVNTSAIPQVSVIRGVGLADSVVSLSIPDTPLNLSSQKKNSQEPLRPILVRSPANHVSSRPYQVESSSLIIHPRSTTVHPSSSSTGTPVMTRYSSHGGVILANPGVNKR